MASHTPLLVYTYVRRHCVKVTVVQRIRSTSGRRNRSFRQTAKTRDRGKRGIRYLPRNVRSLYAQHYPIVAHAKHIEITSVTFRYYEGGISSVYLWDLDDGGFAGVVLFKKGRISPTNRAAFAGYLTPNPGIVLNPASPAESIGSWDSIHVFEASERGRQAHYKLTSTIMLNMVNSSEKQANEDGKKTTAEIGLSGSMTRQVSPNPFHSPLRPRLRLWVLSGGGVIVRDHSLPVLGAPTYLSDDLSCQRNPDFKLRPERRFRRSLRLM